MKGGDQTDTPNKKTAFKKPSFIRLNTLFKTGPNKGSSSNFANNIEQI